MDAQYERHYGVQLLDDIHNYFPALLYDSRRFRTVQDVLQYVITNTQNRFNLFQRGQRNYNQTPRNTPLVTPDEYVTETIDITPLFTSRFARPPTNITRPATAATATSRIFNIPFNLSTGNEMSDVYEELFSSLRGLASTANLDPVIVHPTTLQIDAATELSMANSQQEGELCSICQDRYTEGQAIRKIRHCSHAFHKSCIDEWFERNVHCPICRYDIRDNNE
jgi:hypothetical protein